MQVGKMNSELANPKQQASVDSSLPSALPKKVFQRKWVRISASGAISVLLFGGVGFLNGVEILKPYQIQIMFAAGALSVVTFFIALFWDFTELGADVKKALFEIQDIQSRVSAPLAKHEKQFNELSKKLTSLQPVLEATTKNTRQNAEFIYGGIIGLQRKSIEIELIPVEDARLRYALYGHLPSHIRNSELTVPVARELYSGWTPDRLIEGYTKLINIRWRAHEDFLSNGGECWEFFTKDSLDEYAFGRTEFDPIIDPVEERKARFEKLKELNRMEKYHLQIFEKGLGSDLLLRASELPEEDFSFQKGEILIPLRLPDSVTNFEESCYGVYSHSAKTVNAYQKKVELMLASAVSKNRVISDPNILEETINKWISEIR